MRSFKEDFCKVNSSFSPSDVMGYLVIEYMSETTDLMFLLKYYETHTDEPTFAGFIEWVLSDDCKGDELAYSL